MRYWKRETKSILILGAGQMQLPAIQIAKKRDWYTVVADGSEHAPGRSLADRFLHIDLKDVDSLIQAARQIKEEQGLDGVFTAGTDFSLSVATIAKALSLPGQEVETAYAASDKLRMRQVLSRGGIRVPAFCELSGTDIDQDTLPDFPLVVKPVDNMGARGVRRVDNMEELAEALPVAFASSRSGRVIAESYLAGPEFSIDALVVDGEIRFYGIADRHITFEPYFVEMGHTIPSESTRYVLKKVKRAFSMAVRALRIDNGAAKGDIKFHQGQAWIGEIAARLSGGFMSGWTYPLSSGIKPTADALDLAVGIVPKAPGLPRRRTCAERGFISIPGKVLSLSRVEEQRDRPGIKELFVHVKPGDRVQFPENNVQKCGSVLGLDRRWEKACGAADEAAAAALVRLEPADMETGAFLFGHKAQWIPDFFKMKKRENLDVLEQMPEMIELSENQEPSLFLPLPDPESEVAFDCYGRSLKDALRDIKAILKEEGRDPGNVCLGSLFWEALQKGGVQGAVWLFDTLESLGAAGLKEELGRWRNA